MLRKIDKQGSQHLLKLVGISFRDRKYSLFRSFSLKFWLCLVASGCPGHSSSRIDERHNIGQSFYFWTYGDARRFRRPKHCHATRSPRTCSSSRHPHRHRTVLCTVLKRAVLYLHKEVGLHAVIIPGDAGIQQLSLNQSDAVDFATTVIQVEWMNSSPTLLSHCAVTEKRSQSWCS